MAIATQIQKLGRKSLRTLRGESRRHRRARDRRTLQLGDDADAILASMYASEPQPAIQRVIRFIEKHRADYERLPSTDPNAAVFRKIGAAGDPEWNHFVRV